jgi:hypothetical protein
MTREDIKRLIRGGDENEKDKKNESSRKPVSYRVEEVFSDVSFLTDQQYLQRHNG